tara:strand:+ start:303 stop:707 length:405 start_codon:yes stop_codon:yes gene_type:complete
MDIITKNGKKAKRNLTDEERNSILKKQAENKPKRRSNGQLLKGESGNKAGRPKSGLAMVDVFREHKKASEVINKIFDVASTLTEDKPHKDAMSCAKLITERFVPLLKATEMRVDTDGDSNLIYLPSQQDVEDAD